MEKSQIVMGKYRKTELIFDRKLHVGGFFIGIRLIVMGKIYGKWIFRDFTY